MQKTPRWMVAVKNETEKCDTVMPWTRGLRRQAMIARRKASPQTRLTTRSAA